MCEVKPSLTKSARLLVSRCVCTAGGIDRRSGVTLRLRARRRPGRQRAQSLLAIHMRMHGAAALDEALEISRQSFVCTNHVGKQRSPPSSGNSRVSSIAPRPGSGLYERSECKWRPASPRPIGLPFSTTFETSRISGYPCRSNWFSTWTCYGPKRQQNATCACGVNFASRKTSRPSWASQALRMAAMLTSDRFAASPRP